MAPADVTHSPRPEELMEFLDGEGTAVSRTAIEAHLAQCAACQDVASEQRRLSAEVKAWDLGPAPASLRAPQPPRRRLLRFRVPAWIPSARKAGVLGAAAILIAAVSFTLALRLTNPYRSSRVMTFRDDGAEMQERAKPEFRPGTESGRAAMAAPPFAGRSVPTDSTAREAFAVSRPVVGAAEAPDPSASQTDIRTPAIIRTAKLRIVANDFNSVRAAVEQAVTTAGGFVDQLTVTSEAGLVRSVRGTLRIPEGRLDEVAARLRQLGQVLEDTQGSEDVTDQLVDLKARLASSRATERRLTELLGNRTAKLSDVLEVERELARVRLDVERLDAETANLGHRVSYAALTIEIMEERKVGLTPGPLSLASRFRVAAADGFESAAESIVWILLTIMQAGPVLILWTIIAGFAWILLRRMWRPKPGGAI